jgi:hypothetical protein
MGLKKISTIPFLFLLLLAVSTPDVSAKRIYRWVDDKGHVRFSDTVPPKHAKHRRESLNKKARVVEVIEKQKTKAQRALDKRLARLRKRQEEIIRKQKIRDKVLLSTFRSTDDMELALAGKMLTLDGQRKVMQGNLDRLEKQRKQQRGMAAQHERDGRKAPNDLVEEISSSRRQINKMADEVAKQLEKKKKVRKKLEKDIARYIYLTQSKSNTGIISRKSAENKAELELGLYFCETTKICDKAWKHARKFVYIYSGTEFYIESDKLIMSQEPEKKSEFSLSVSKQNSKGDKLELFLDIRCHNSSMGREVCRGAEIHKIRRLFSNFIKSELASEKITG